MPRLFDSLALSLALAACSPAAGKIGPNGGQSRTPDRVSTVGGDVQNPGSRAEAPADEYSCKKVQNAVNKDITRCCLSIKPYLSCHDMDQAKAAEFEKENTVETSGGKIPRYARYKDTIPAEKYLSYIANTAKTAAEIAEVLTTFVNYQTIDDNSLLSAEEIITRGTGDCDNMANLFIDVLKKLGTKSGFDYQTKIIGLDTANHAVAVFKDKDGKWKSFDFKVPFYEIRDLGGGAVDLYTASEIFEKHRMDDCQFYERKRLEPVNEKATISDDIIFSEAMRSTEKDLALMVNMDYDANIDPGHFLKNDNWKKTKITRIHFLKDITVYYKYGVLLQISDTTKITIYDKDRNIVEVQLKKKTPKKTTESK
jgi:hypothetical protein